MNYSIDTQKNENNLASPEERKTILIVDDLHLNRAMLVRIFNSKYNILEANDGIYAMEYLHKYKDTISAVILDIMMPKMDGYDVLRSMQKESYLAVIPVIIISAVEDESSHIKALNLGARDVIVKPFNPEIVKRRVENIISGVEFTKAVEREKIYEAQLESQRRELYMSQHDDLTGHYNRKTFTLKAKEILKNAQPNSYVLSCLDIDSFKVINERYGHEEGDRLLKYVALTQRKELEAINGIACRDMADLFFTLLPNDKKLLDIIAKRASKTISSYNLPTNITVHIGRYIIEDPHADVNSMIDRALLAVKSIKGSADKLVAIFNADMQKGIMRQQELEGEMRNALANDQFVLYFQPQYNYSEKTMTGAEALVRWNHPEKGMISPGEFIPLFEKNGFITKLDPYIWEQTCRYLRKWLDDGFDVVPVSVNISRRDILSIDVTRVISKLVKKYDIPPYLLHLEITESAYLDNPSELIKIVSDLQKMGFEVEMDDFGSGYSSLNILKDVPVDTLKLDMKFISESCNNSRGGSILSSVVRMAHWLKMPVIAEGVETFQQSEYLKSIGCNLMQGFYFNKPMPGEGDFEQLLKTSKTAKERFVVSSKGINGAKDFLDASTQATLLFNSFVGGAYIAEYNGTNVEVLRTNDRLYEVLKCTRKEYEPLQIHLLQRLYPESQKIYMETLKEAIKTGEETFCELHSLPVREGSKDFWTLNHFRFLAQDVDRYMFYVSVENITERKELEEKTYKYARELKSTLSSIPENVLKAYINKKDMLKLEDILTDIHNDKNKLSQYNMDKLRKNSCHSNADFDILHSIFKYLYEATNMNKAINGILKLLGNHYSVSRVYIFEDEDEHAYVSNTFEWCAEGIEPEKDNLQHLSYKTGLDENYMDLFNDDNIFLCTDVTRLTKGQRDCLMPQGIRSMLQCLLKNNGKPTGFIGFDDCTGKILWSDEMIQTLAFSAMLIETFLVKWREMNINECVDISKCKKIQSELLMTKELYLYAMLHTNSIVFRIDIKEKVAIIPDIMATRCDLEVIKHNIPQSVLTDKKVDENHRQDFYEFFKAIIDGVDGKTVEIRYEIAGNMNWYHGEYKILRNAEKEATTAIVIFTNINSEKQNEAVISSLKEKKRLIQMLSKHAKKYLTIYDFATDTFNPLEDSLNFFGNLLPLYSSPAEYFKHDLIAKQSKDELKKCYNMLRKGRLDNNVKFKAKSLDNKWHWFDCTISTVTDEDGKPEYAIASFEDITKEYKIHMELVNRAQIDSVTGICNRATFIENVQEKVKKFSEKNFSAFAMVDVDHFKSINDSFGHQKGDNVLSMVSQTIASHLSDKYCAGRLGGDELGMIICGLKNKKEIEEKANKIISTIVMQDFGIDKPVSVSMGIVIIDNGSYSFDDLYQKADIALYKAKQQGRNRYVFYKN